MNHKMLRFQPLFLDIKTKLTWKCDATSYGFGIHEPD